MKTKHMTVGIAALGLSAAAVAQGVVLGGIADAAVRRVSNEGRGHATALVSGSNATSRIFFRGREDLGDGLWAGFHLEHGLLIDSGMDAVATQFFDRRSTVSLGSRQLGELRAGRDFVPSYVSWSRFDPFSYVGVAGSNNLVTATPAGPIRSAFGTGANTTVRSSNAVQWLAPEGLGGFEAGLLHAFAEGGLAANGLHKVSGVRVGYVAGPINVSAATTRTSNDLTAPGGSFRDTSAGAAWDFGVARVSLAVRRFAQAQARQTNAMLGAWIPVGSGEVKFSYVRADLEGNAGATRLEGNDAHQLGLGYVHNLSKRTALYATVARIDNRGAAAFAIPGVTGGVQPGGKSRGVELGLRHSF